MTLGSLVTVGGGPPASDDPTIFKGDMRVAAGCLGSHLTIFAFFYTSVGDRMMAGRSHKPSDCHLPMPGQPCTHPLIVRNKSPVALLYGTPEGKWVKYISEQNSG